MLKVTPALSINVSYLIQDFINRCMDKLGMRLPYVDANRDVEMSSSSPYFLPRNADQRMKAEKSISLLTKIILLPSEKNPLVLKEAVFKSHEELVHRIITVYVERGSCVGDDVDNTVKSVNISLPTTSLVYTLLERVVTSSFSHTIPGLTITSFPSKFRLVTAEKDFQIDSILAMTLHAASVRHGQKFILESVSNADLQDPSKSTSKTGVVDHVFTGVLCGELSVTAVGPGIAGELWKCMVAILSQPRYFNHLYALLMSASSDMMFSEKIWTLLMLLPTDHVLMAGLQKVSPTEHDWGTLLPSASSYGLWYPLQIVCKLVREENLVSAKKLALKKENNEAVLMFNDNDVAFVPQKNNLLGWTELFLKTGGVSHLLSALMSSSLLNIDVNMTESSWDQLYRIFYLLDTLKTVLCFDNGWETHTDYQGNTKNVLVSHNLVQGIRIENIANYDQLDRQCLVLFLVDVMLMLAQPLLPLPPRHRLLYIYTCVCVFLFICIYIYMCVFTYIFLYMCAKYVLHQSHYYHAVLALC